MHKHRAVRRSHAYPFTGPVRFPGERGHNPAAYGNVVFAHYCRCGAHRSTNVNGWHREVGPWAAPE